MRIVPFDQTKTPEFVPSCSFEITSALFQAMKWHRTGDKPTYDSIVIIKFFDTYVHHQVGEIKHYNSILCDMFPKSKR